MNKADLIEALAPRLGGRAQAALAVESVVDLVLREVAAGGSVGITGFGTFERVERAPRTGRNPRTGEAVPIAGTVSPRFRPGTYFKDVVSTPAELPADGLAGARVSSTSASAPSRAGAPASVRRAPATTRAAEPAVTPAGAEEATASSSPRAKAKSQKASTGAPATVRASKPKDETPKAPKKEVTLPKGGLVTGGEEITAKILTAKKAELAKVKNDERAKKKDKDKKKSKKDKKKD